MSRISVPFLAAVYAIAMAVSAPAHGEEHDPRTGDHVIDRSRKVMGTYADITVWAADDTVAAQAIDEAFGEFDRLDRMMTTWVPDSEVSRINAAAGTGKAVAVSPELFDCLVRAIEYSRLSGGLFDITVGAFSGVWKFDEDNDGSIPERSQVDERRKLVGWKDVILDPQRRSVRLRRPGMKITLGGIAKGFAVDRATQVLRRHGLVDFIVRAGGDMYVSGRHGDRRWRVGIRDPRGPRDAIFAAADVEDMTFSTSGDYERFTVKDGKRYHHILDPRTGYPADASRSVTVMAKDATLAEGISKTLFILGPEKGMEFLKKVPGVEAVIVGADNEVHVSEGLRDVVRILHPPSVGI
jgi:thiamine biosynthesis lipoprotein